MRISDWSSDVCSSDLAQILFNERASLLIKVCNGFHLSKRKIEGDKDKYPNYYNRLGRRVNHIEPDIGHSDKYLKELRPAAVDGRLLSSSEIPGDTSVGGRIAKA